jgi:hypothetical protein
MKPPAGGKIFTVLLLLTMVLLAPGCASDGSYTQAQVGVYGYGYPGGYPGYYHGDVIVGAPLPPPGAVRPPGGAPPPHASQLPARPLPAPAPRPMPAARPMGGGGRR